MTFQIQNLEFSIGIISIGRMSFVDASMILQALPHHLTNADISKVKSKKKCR